MVLLTEVTKLMPPSGIVIRRFQIKDDAIDIQGEARDAQTAVQFMEDLQKHSVLSRYTWSKPSPNVRNGKAEFRTQGKAQ
jgi:geranylgeranyl pyrophosphate synthase